MERAAGRYSTIKPELGATLVNVSSRWTGVEEIDLGSGPVQTSTWETIIVGMPLKVSEWVNSNGDVLKMHIDSGSGLIEGERLCVAARPGRAKLRPR